MSAENQIWTVDGPDSVFRHFAEAHAEGFSGKMIYTHGVEKLELFWHSGYLQQGRFHRSGHKVAPPAGASNTWPMNLAFSIVKGECKVIPRPPEGYPGFPIWELMRQGIVDKLGRNGIVDRANARRPGDVAISAEQAVLKLGRLPVIQKLLKNIETPVSVNAWLNKTDDPFTLAVDLELLHILRLVKFSTDGPVSRPPTRKPADHILVLGRHLVSQRRWREAATCLFRYRSPSSEATALFAWSRFMSAPEDEGLKKSAARALEKIIRESPGKVHFYSYLAAIHRLDGRYEEAEKLLLAAYEQSPNDESITRELTLLRLRTTHPKNFTPVKVRDYRAEIAIQRWIGAHSIVHTMRKRSCTVGSSRTDDIVVSSSVCQRILPRHCLISKNDEGVFLIRRNRKSGKVFVNSQLLEVGEDTPLGYTDIVTLGSPPPAGDIEFRLLELKTTSAVREVLGDTVLHRPGQRVSGALEDSPTTASSSNL